MTKVVISICGGIIQTVIADKECEIITIDFDTDGSDETDKIELSSGRKVDAFIANTIVKKNKKEVNHFFGQWEKAVKETEQKGKNFCNELSKEC
jgi:hypothetical protein